MEGHQPSYRTGERVYPERQRVAWGPAGGGPLRPGEVRDVSYSGVGLLVRGEAPPRAGELLRVMGRDDAGCRRARVVRTEDDRDGATLLGCRWVSEVVHRPVRSATQRRALRRFLGRRWSTNGGEQR